MNIPNVTLYRKGLLGHKPNCAFFDQIERQPVANEARLKKTLKEQIRMMLSEVRFLKMLSNLLRLMAVSATATILIAALLSYWIAVACTAARPPFPFLLVAVAEDLPLVKPMRSTDTKLTPKTQIPPAISRNR